MRKFEEKQIVTPKYFANRVVPHITTGWHFSSRWYVAITHLCPTRWRRQPSWIERRRSLTVTPCVAQSQYV